MLDMQEAELEEASLRLSCAELRQVLQILRAEQGELDTLY